EGGLDLAGRQAAVARPGVRAPRGRRVRQEVALDDARGVVDAAVADVDLRGLRPGHHRGDLVGGAAAERAADEVVAAGVHRGRGGAEGDAVGLRNRIGRGDATVKRPAPFGNRGRPDEGGSGKAPAGLGDAMETVLAPSLLPPEFVERLYALVPPGRVEAVLATFEAPRAPGFR